jgi:hypothetical protein
MNATIVVATVVLVLALWFPILPQAQATSTILLAVFAAVNASLLVIKYRRACTRRLSELSNCPSLDGYRCLYFVLAFQSCLVVAAIRLN